MKRFLIVWLLSIGMVSLLCADVTMHQRTAVHPVPVHPVEPERPIVVRPYVDTAFVDNRIINNNYESCEKYKEHIDELNAYIEQLEAQVKELKEKEYVRMREKLKEKNTKELKAFEERKSSSKSKSSIIITEKPGR